MLAAVALAVLGFGAGCDDVTHSRDGLRLHPTKEESIKHQSRLPWSPAVTVAIFSAASTVSSSFEAPEEDRKVKAES